MCITPPWTSPLTAALEAAIERLVDALSHGSFPAQVQNSTTDRNAIRKICEACSTIDYKMEDDVNQSPTCLGLVGERAEGVSAAKTKFKALCTPCKGIRFRIPIKGENSPTKALKRIEMRSRCSKMLGVD